ncbi:malonyl-CoA decarboxylase, mitochondrial-like isoform X1 [Mytilus trossulus]|uniref:malonyl-CoA decarboxylase, mitochondrial-like isoform X1 n=2 Tax=Mytilus trossulus TaxID=6551 RepID=UPI003007BB0A
MFRRCFLSIFTNARPCKPTSKCVHKRALMTITKGQMKIMNGGDTHMKKRTLFTERASDFLESVFSSSDVSILSSEVKSRDFCQFYNNLETKDRMVFLSMLARQYGLHQDIVLETAKNVIASEERGDAVILRVEERLRQSLVPQYQQLFRNVSRHEGGVKFLVDMRADILTNITSISNETDSAYLRSTSNSVRDLLTLWFTVGFLNLQRVTWESPCDMVQKVSDYEAVHPIRNWTDLKRRVGPYRRCFVFTHSSMPREPVVVLHTALTNEITKSIHSILQTGQFKPIRDGDVPEEDLSVNSETEDSSKITTAIFYSITSTQKGLQGIDLGNYLIKQVVRELQSEFPRIYQFSSLSPIPGFKEWLIMEINRNLHADDIGETVETPLLLDSEIEKLKPVSSSDCTNMYEALKRLLTTHEWVSKELTCKILQSILLRLCARYLYVEKRRGYALNPVANFHLSNGAVLWRINWLSDMSMRGINQSCGMMVNYRYFLDNTTENSKRYLENHHIEASPEIVELGSLKNVKKDTDV